MRSIHQKYTKAKETTFHEHTKTAKLNNISQFKIVVNLTGLMRPMRVKYQIYVHKRKVKIIETLENSQVCTIFLDEWILVVVYIGNVTIKLSIRLRKYRKLFMSNNIYIPYPYNNTVITVLYVRNPFVGKCIQWTIIHLCWINQNEERKNGKIQIC